MLNNVTWPLIDKAFRLIFAVMSSVLIARYLGPDDYGVYTYAWSLVSILLVIAAFGTEATLVEAITSVSGREVPMLRAAIVLRLLVAVVLFSFLVVIFLVWHDSNLGASFVVMSLIVLPNLFMPLVGYFRARELSRYIAIGGLVTVVTGLCIKVAMIELDYGVIGVSIALLIEACLFAGCMWFFYLRVAPPRGFCHATDQSDLLNLFKQSLPLLISGLMLVGFNKIDMIVVMNVLGAGELGVYAIAARLCEVWFFIPVSVFFSVMPALVKANQESEREYEIKLQKMLDLMLLTAVLGSFFFTLIADLLVSMLYGEEYLNAAYLLKIKAWSSVFVFGGVLTSGHAVIVKKNWRLVVRNAMCMVVALPLLLFGAHLGGLLGVAYASVIASFFAYVFMDLIAFPNGQRLLRMKVLAFGVFLNGSRMFGSIRVLTEGSVSWRR